MKGLSLALSALGFSVVSLAQISVQEPATRARLVDGVTNISLSLKNATKLPLDAQLELRWLGPRDDTKGIVRQRITVEPGDSSLNVPLPLSKKYDPLLNRLRYDILPAERNYTAFAGVRGILNLVDIADYAFTLKVVTADIPRPGKPFEVRVLTLRARSGEPVPGVKVSCDEVTATSDSNGMALLKLVADPDDDEPEFDIEAQIGDFEQNGESARLTLRKGDIQIYTDKPLYQPGQTMHVRVLERGGDGGVRADTENSIRIMDENGSVEHAATVTTSKFGVAWTDWAIPDNAKSGKYEIEVKSDEFDRPISRDIRIRRYELPSFRVTAKLDRPYYVRREKAAVDIRADYLFGKPVNGGRVRLIEDEEDKPLYEGSLSADGHALVNIDTDREMPELARFIDLHFAAFVTDASTNRTEQRKFDLRISRDPLHVYIAKTEYVPGGRRVYITTYSPDGKPAVSDVEVSDARGSAKVLGRGRTNRFGLARIDLPPGEEPELTVNAVADDGRRSTSRERRYYGNDRPAISLGTDRSLYKPGEIVKCSIRSFNGSPSVLLMAWNEHGAILVSKKVVVKGEKTEIDLPYDKRFGRRLSLGVVSSSGNATATRAVLFPGPDELVLRAIPVKATYRPGDTARISFKASGEAALGVAIVDQSVYERAATDAEFGGRHWFNQDWRAAASIAGITESDLMGLDPAKIDADLELVAEVLVETPSLENSGEEFSERARTAFAESTRSGLDRVSRALDEEYLSTLQYPRDEAALFGITNRYVLSVDDPWLRPYFTKFSTEGPEDVLRFMSAGPDRKLGTDDDFCALKVERKWFGKFEALIDQRLRSLADYPSTPEEFIRTLADGGIRFEALRDPWSNPMRAEVSYVRDRREIRIESAGPDKMFDSDDDFVVAQFTGRYFASWEAKIDQALSPLARLPRTADEFRTALKSAGIDFDSLRDPWGHSYYPVFRTEEEFTDRLRMYSYAEYNGPPEARKQVIPIKRQRQIVEIRSAGEDGIHGTYDDFVVASINRLADQDAEQPGELVKTIAPPSFSIGGTGTITGVVTDASGAVIPNARVTLNSVYTAQADGNGVYMFKGLPPGFYRLQFESPGFQQGVVDRAPVKPDNVTRIDTVLQVGTVSETVEVAASNVTVETSSAQVSMLLAPAAPAVLSTPRVREYFPETLYWAPEIITDESGRASVEVKLADSVTNWRVAVIGSTIDGRVSESTADIKAFQPFLVDFDVPPVLTIGDEIALPAPVRNYLERAQKAIVSITVPKAIGQREAIRQPSLVAPGSSSNAVVALLAEAAAAKAVVRVTAVSREASDAIEKPVAIHPFGERKETSASGVVQAGRIVRLDLPPNALAGTVQAQVKIYPSLLSRVLESIEALLTRPHGCAEQTISSAYPNLLFLRALRDAGLVDAKQEARAMKNLQIGYERLLGYQGDAGGFTYWGRGEPDIALTQYALIFLGDLKGFVEIDDERAARARAWLAKQASHGDQEKALQALALAHAGPERAADVDRLLRELAVRAAEFDDPYAIATFALAAMDAGKEDLARAGVARLTGMAQDEQGAAYWVLKANTPFHGWGRSGQVETTALVVSALAKWRRAGHADDALTPLIDRGALFLMKSADSSGAWATSQSTVRALIALLDTWGKDSSRGSNLEVWVNGVSAGKVSVPGGLAVRGPVIMDVSEFVKPGTTNELSVTGMNSHSLQAQFNAAWYESWGPAKAVKTLALKTHYSATTVSVNDAVTCDVVVSRPSFRGFGMMIAEIGVPPGAEVDRGTLESILEDAKSGVDSYEVAPDHVTFYVWPQAADARFKFAFRPRFPMKARTAQSVVYDYYNPDERAVLPPEMFAVTDAATVYRAQGFRVLGR